jgi:branched-chain amino acid transport system permease protein
MDLDLSFFAEVLVGGLLSGVMYSLVAIGFVLIYKTSGVLNFAQGSMLLFAALTFVSQVERGVPFVLALLATFAAMVVLGIAIERTVLRPLVNRPPIVLFMATLGLSYIIEGAAQLLWGTQVHGLDLGIDDLPLEIGGVLVSKFDLFAAAVAATMVALLTVFFRYTRIGLAFRAVADDQFAALAIGLRLPRIWAAVWAAAGMVALVAGLLWGARLGVQFSLSLVVLKALPVLVLGGFDSILGAIIGGLLIGASEKLAEVYLGPVIGSGIEGWFAYVVALAFLLVRPAACSARNLLRGPDLNVDNRIGHQPCITAAADIGVVLADRLAGRGLWCAAFDWQQLSVRGDPDAFSGAFPGGGWLEYSDGVCRATLAWNGCLHGGGRLRRVQFQPAR